MLKLIKYNLRGLWNSEYPLVIKRIIAIVARFNPEALHLQRAYNALAAFMQQLDKIEKQEQANADSARLSELDQMRDTLFNVILNVCKHFKRTPIESVSKAALLVLNLLKKHGNDIPAANYTAETKRLYDLCAGVRKQPEVISALTSLSLLPLFELMEKANADFDTLFMSRYEKQVETERIDIRAIRIECDKAVNALWSAIEFCMEEYGESDYEGLVNAVNKFNAYYKQQLAARATRRKAKLDITGEEPIQPPVE